MEIAVFQKLNDPVTKTIAIDDEGKLVTDNAACRMASGTARRVRFSGELHAIMRAFAALISNFKPNQVYTLGCLRDDLADFVEVGLADTERAPGVIARTQEFLVFKKGAPGFCLLDVDLKGMSETAAHRLEELGGIWGALCEVFPPFETAAFVERASTSSGLRNSKTGQTFPGSGGRHIVVPVLDVADIRRFLSDLHDHLWRAGLGWFLVSVSGSLLERALIDKSVGTPERPVFEGPPILAPPLVQEARLAVAHDGTVLDTRLLLPLTDGEKAELQRVKDAEGLRLLPERQTARARWSAAHIKRKTAAGIPEAEARAQIDRWLDRHELSGDFPLPFDDAKLAGTTVAQVLAAPAEYIGKTLGDPLDPADGRGKAILYKRPDGSLWIKSFAHGGGRYDLKFDFAAMIAKAEALKKGDTGTLRALASAIITSLEKLQREPVIKAAATAAGIRIEDVRALVKEAEAERVRKAQSSPQALETARIAREHERQRLWRSCKDIAESERLVEDMVTAVQSCGVIGERAGICATYATITSRLLKSNALRLARFGAAASGKNYVPNTGLRFFPEDSIIVMSASSAHALVYMGDGPDDVDAFKHKCMYVPEAVSLARKANGDEPAQTGMLRSLISENRLDYPVVVPQPQGPAKTIHIRRDGPIAMVITTARDNIEAEMLTRLSASNTDESWEQTKKVIEHNFSDEHATTSDAVIETWRNYQRWLELDAPYEVFIPFGKEIGKALSAIDDKLQLRMRRDSGALKTAVEAFAIMHKAQRKRDAKGRIIAEIADYRHAYEAFNDGMAALYGLKPTPAQEAAYKAVRGIMDEAKHFETDAYSRKSFKITVSALAKKLGVSSNDTAAGRLDNLVEFGAIEEDTERRGFGLAVLGGSSRSHPGISHSSVPTLTPPSRRWRDSIGRGGGWILTDRTDRTDKTLTTLLNQLITLMKRRVLSVRILMLFCPAYGQKVPTPSLLSVY
jgi:hypothetical protein